MTANDQEDLRHGEAIVPVQAIRRRAAGELAPAVAGPRRLRRGALVAGGLALAAGLWAALMWLPQRSAMPVPATVPDVLEPMPADAGAPAPEPEVQPELQAEAERLLAQILTQQDRLRALNAGTWAAEDYARYEALARAGDDAYLAQSYAAATSSYRETIELGAELLARSETLVASALAAAEQAFAAADWQLAMAHFDLVLSVDAEHAAALSGRRRAERLPEVLALLEQGRTRERTSDWTGAADAYRAAVAIDSQWEPAQTALEQALARVADQRFEGLLSDGFAALSSEDFPRAIEIFQQALELRPNAAAARDGLAQAEQGTALDAIALAEARALAFERRERWQEAISQYQAALATDPTLAFARSGLERAQARADLDAKLANLIEKPDLLLRDAVLSDAESLLAQATAIESQGPRLAGQVTELQRLIQLASTPLPVLLQSDAVTEVTLFRVGALGQFSEKRLELRPGTYTAVGSRKGYRDVRETFTVLPGRELAPVLVRCVEPI